MTQRNLAALLAVSVGISAVRAACPLYYSVTDLGALPGTSTSRAYSINNSGEVVGESNGLPFYWHAGTMIALPRTGLAATTPFSINEHGDIAGTANFSGAPSAIWWRRLTANQWEVRTLGSGWALDINEQRQIVGTHSVAGIDGQVAVVWRDEDGTYHELPGLGGLGNAALAVNNQGTVVGRAQDPNPNVESHAVRWVEGELDDLGLGRAVDINESGVILAEGWTIYEGNVSSVGFNGQAINARGDVVGYSWPSAMIQFSYTCCYSLSEHIPPGSGWELRYAFDVNDSGQIVGEGYLNGVSNARAFLLTPVYCADLDRNGAVSLPDLAILLSCFGGCSAGDVDCDGDTDLTDLALLLRDYGDPCP